MSHIPAAGTAQWAPVILIGGAIFVFQAHPFELEPMNLSAEYGLFDFGSFELEGHHETTIGGYLSEELGRVPRPGEEVDLHGRRFKVSGVEETRVTELALVADDDDDGDG